MLTVLLPAMWVMGVSLLDRTVLVSVLRTFDTAYLLAHITLTALTGAYSLSFKYSVYLWLPAAINAALMMVISIGMDA